MSKHRECPARRVFRDDVKGRIEIGRCVKPRDAHEEHKDEDGRTWTA